MNRPSRRRILPAVVLAAALGAAPAEAVVLRDRPVAGGPITAMAPGRAGTLWYAGSGRLGRLPATAGEPALRVRLSSGADPSALTADGAGGVWFIDGGSAIGHADGRGHVRRHPADAGGGGLAADGRGNVWFTTGHRWVGRMDRRGRVRRFPIAVVSRGPIARGTGGTMWFAARGQVGAMSASGRVRWHLIPDEPVRGIAVRRDGTWVLTPSTVWWMRRGRQHEPGFTGVPDDTARFEDGGPVAAGAARSTLAVGPGRRLWISVPRLGQFAQVTVHGVRPPSGPGLDEPAGPVRAGAAALAYDTRGRMWTATTDGVAEVVFAPSCVVPDAVASSEAAGVAALRAGGCGSAVAASGAGGANDRVVRAQSAPPGAVLPIGATVTLTTSAPVSCVFPAGTRTLASPAPGLLLADRFSWIAGGDERIDHWMCPLSHPVAERLPSTMSYNELEAGSPGRFGFAVAGDRLAYYVTDTGAHYQTEYGLVLHVRHVAPGPGEQIVRLEVVADTPIAVNERGDVALTGLLSAPHDIVVLRDGVTRSVGTSTTTYPTHLSIDATTVHWTDDDGLHDAPIDPDP